MKSKHFLGLKGETGIGTLIVFIAIVLVAAIAASVLLGTAGSLQQRSLTTGKQTEREVSGGINVVTVSAIDGSNANIENFEVLIKLAAGSDPLAFDETIITFDTKNTSQDLEYTSTANESSSSLYNISYVKQGSEYKSGYISTGDVVKLGFASTRSIVESETVRMRVIPKHGVIVPVDFVTPDVMTQKRIILYP